jgi:cytochrome c2
MDPSGRDQDRPMAGQQTVASTASPLRWLLVIVPLLVLVIAAGYLVSRAANIAPGLRAVFQEPPREVRTTKSPPPGAGSSTVGNAPRPTDAPPTVPEAEFDIAAVLARLPSADPADGDRLARMCDACHAREKNAAHKLAPTLWGTIDLPKATHRGFNYSAALKAKGGTWTYRELALYLNNPRKHVPGTSMAFAGIADPGRLASVIAYLRTLADKPAPLPK